MTKGNRAADKSSVLPVGRYRVVYVLREESLVVIVVKICATARFTADEKKLWSIATPVSQFTASVVLSY